MALSQSIFAAREVDVVEELSTRVTARAEGAAAPAGRSRQLTPPADGGESKEAGEGTEDMEGFTEAHHHGVHRTNRLAASCD